TGCLGNTFTLSVTVYPDAKITAPATLAQCEDVASIALGGSIGYAPNGISWSGGQGTFTNPTDINTATYAFKNPNEINTTVVLTLMANPPGGPCGAVSVQTNLKINRLPDATFSGFTKSIYAQNDPPITLSASKDIRDGGAGLFTISTAGSSLGSTTQVAAPDG